MTNLNPHQVGINLTISQDGSDYGIYFTFDVKNDDIDEVVSELVKTCNLDEEEGLELKRVMESQLQQAIGQLPPPEITHSNTKPKYYFEPSDDADLANEKEYQALLAQQRKALADIESRHDREQKEMISRLKGVPVNSHKIVDDLIVFS
ncbi:hypothetical protein TVAG_474580 [Trichomonas vaginalis G3]|uniref:Uncharacterized protein n=1 Tax=Trichomonas vaginalis (strain ATCC PRA-98 / G3) TaxID=412133 RepID=A2ESZ4_TRIV3|nr:hypothetical protein TVAGG3_0191580 [Trichomonas vaginalis G3]EAY04252.1 hypothetical protein TVAG_474580 [Trichomonas vaginalis G3]KAI5550007.1 hypothetical protein TVAGG3_0191580 [Trichomonas vaginalis G3]|eukprot:XP_001316475.1 hypothetical protein [Trichomonas vaginalis G3]